MIDFLKSLFGAKEEQVGDGQNKNRKKDFEMFKFDGLRAQRMGRTDYAVKCFTNALMIEEDFETMGYLSRIYIQTHKPDEARRMLNRMIALEPEWVDTYLTMAHVCYIQENYADMAKAAQKAIELEDGNANACYLLAKAHQGLQEDRMAIAQLTKAIDLKNDFMEALLMRAEVWLQMEQHREAQKDIEAALELNGEEETALLLRGKLKQATGDAEGAENDFKMITGLNPFNEQAYLYLAQLYIAQKKLTEAIGLLDEAIELNPDSAAAFRERGKAKLLNGDKDGSAEDMEQALQLGPKETENLNESFDNPGRNPSGILGNLG
jgi:tetratricopeptide (TPR) repeat protein